MLVVAFKIASCIFLWFLERVKGLILGLAGFFVSTKNKEMSFHCIAHICDNPDLRGSTLFHVYLNFMESNISFNENYFEI